MAVRTIVIVVSYARGIQFGRALVLPFVPSSILIQISSSHDNDGDSDVY